MPDKRQLAAAFGAAASTYDDASAVQALCARRLAAHVEGGWDKPDVLDVGGGTGHLARALAGRWPRARLVLADLAPEMLEVARAKGLGPGVVADAEALPFAAGRFDIVASNCTLQWCADVPETLRRMAGLLRPGGVLAVTALLAETWAEWRAAHARLGLVPSMMALPSETEFRRALPFADWIGVETVLRPYRRGREFLDEVKRLGAGTRAGDALSPGDLARVLREFERDGAVASYQVATVLVRRPARAGVFVAGTDTGVGKTVAAAILAHALEAAYWKPVQTGLAEEAGDTAFVAGTGVAVHRPAFEFAAPLSAHAAAELEGVRLRLDDFALPGDARPLVVEAAGGVASPLDETHDMADLARHLGLPVVLVARSKLGTINHTLTAVESLRSRGVPLLGVVLVGDPNPGNRAEIERRGNVRILLEIPWLARLDGQSLHAWAANVPLRAAAGWTFCASQAWFTNC